MRTTFQPAPCIGPLWTLSAGVLLFLSFAAILSLPGCQPADAPKSKTPLSLRSEAESGMTRMTSIFFATNRSEDIEGLGSAMGELQIGKCEVGVPVAADGRLIRDDAGLPVVGEVHPDAPIFRRTLGGGEFFSELSALFSLEGCSEALVFVPPGTMGFSEAARCAASIAVELDFRGAVFLFSWPAEDDALDYEADEKNVMASTADFSRFLEAVKLDGNPQRLHILARGLGARLVLSTLDQLARGPYGTGVPWVEQVILVAPDVPTSQVKGKRMDGVLEMCETLTVYASTQDRDLKTAERTKTYPRLGDSLKHACCTSDPRCFAIDASTWDTSMGNAPGYGAVGAIVDDIRLLLDGADPLTRGLYQAQGDGWILGDFNRCLGGRLRPSQSTQSAARIRLMRR